MKLFTALIVVVVAAAAKAGYVDPYETGLAVSHHDGAYYGDHYDAGYASLGHHVAGYDPAHYGAYHYDPSGTFSYWGSHGPTVVQQNAASLAHPVHGAHPYAPYSAPYGLYGAPGATVVQANLGANHWGYPAVYGAAYGHGYGYDKYLATAPATKYLL
ncbi:shematrin-like protein 1 [Anopheles albimanus]|uniref:shematrin-like protein 1 n=1 Tax=Anopheles albimanus TaxID=7167 RepID=UPI00164129DE|nr:shematrin-like protein 1 [Anopheles albimanus]